MTVKTWWHVGVVLAIGLLARSGWAEDKEADDGPPKTVIKVYRVSDLVTPVASYPYEMSYLPGGARATGTPVGSSISGGMGGMGGGMGGMGGTPRSGGGMFQVADNPAGTGPTFGGPGNAAAGTGRPAAARPAKQRLEMGQLINAITEIVDPESWDGHGGFGGLQPVGGALAIRQTAENQTKVQDLLEALRKESSTASSVVVQARWLMLDDAQLAAVRGKAKADAPAPAMAIDREALKALPETTQRFAGQIACFNGQTVHIVSGELESIVQSFLPIIGGNEVGYQPVVQLPHIGVLLQVTPSLPPGEQTAVLDLHSCVMRMDPPNPCAASTKTREKAADDKGPHYPTPLDRLRVASQQFSTSARVPLNQPVLIGGMTFPDVEAGSKEGQLYLIVEVSAK